MSLRKAIGSWNSAYSSWSSSKYRFAWPIRLRSRRVSWGLPRKLATMVSVAGSEAPQAIAESAVSMPVAPASAAAK